MPVELSQEQAIVYIDGDYVPFKEAKISVFDHGLLYGDAVYDTCFAWAGAIFKLNAHVERLFQSAYAVAIQIPLTKEQMKRAILDTFAKNRLESAYIKILGTRGLGKQPLLPPIDCTPSVVVFAVPYTGAVYSGEVGIKATVVSRRHIPSVCLESQVKSCNYLNFVLSRVRPWLRGRMSRFNWTWRGTCVRLPAITSSPLRREPFLRREERS